MIFIYVHVCAIHDKGLHHSYFILCKGGHHNIHRNYTQFSYEEFQGRSRDTVNSDYSLPLLCNRSAVSVLFLHHCSAFVVIRVNL